MKKTKRRSGSNFCCALRLALAMAPLAGGLLTIPAFSRFAVAAGRKTAPADYAVIAGTVFRDPGFALPGAEITLAPVPAPGSQRKLKKQKALSSPRGEFAFRVPSGPMQYTVSVTCKGFQPLQKSASIQAGERVDVNFLLEPSSGKHPEPKNE